MSEWDELASKSKESCMEEEEEEDVPKSSPKSDDDKDEVQENESDVWAQEGY